MNTIIDALNWRYATKKFDTNKKLSQNDLDILFESMRLTPSAFGLQPWKFIHVQNPETRVALQENSRGQPQITEASDLVVIAVKNNMQESDVDEYIQDMIETRKVDLENIPEDFKNTDKLVEYKNMMINTISSKTQEQLKGRNQKQAYIVLGFLLSTCAQMGIDACPMEGFDPEKYNEILGLHDLGLSATVVVTLGYRSSEDKYSDLKKVRFAKEKLIIQK
ncbi:MAG TPA: NAD(P)H-dependent oxidoreductase [Candidatus Absconditabacterales bacterium]|nr:NAD(P)H-dependent oxidoreductase [Candidatus Absconditabacterales bacterium]